MGHRQKPFPYKIYFVHPYADRWGDLYNGDYLPDPNEIYSRFSTSNDVWIAQTYLQLKRFGLDVSLRPRLVSDSINVIMNYDLRIKSLAYRGYVISCRADTFRSFICNHTIVQNGFNVMTKTDHLIQHWPQPGLIRRNSSRGVGVRALAYMGGKQNLCSVFREEKFHQELRRLGFEFAFNEDASKFHDYQNCDVVIAVRDLTETDYLAKPASKLINAWHAGVPALLGPEPAFRALKKSELDYIEVKSPHEVISALTRLRSSPQLYRSMIENGFARALDFTPERIAERWHEVLAGPVADGYAYWKRRSHSWKVFARPIIYGFQAGRTTIEKRRYVHQCEHGFRPISGRYT
jgi:hypothetical protein